MSGRNVSSISGSGIDSSARSEYKRRTLSTSLEAWAEQHPVAREHCSRLKRINAVLSVACRQMGKHQTVQGDWT